MGSTATTSPLPVASASTGSGVTARITNEIIQRSIFMHALLAGSEPNAGFRPYPAPRTGSPSWRCILRLAVARRVACFAKLRLAHLQRREAAWTAAPLKRAIGGLVPLKREAGQVPPPVRLPLFVLRFPMPAA